MRTKSITLIFLILSTMTFGQNNSLYMPREIKAAIKKGTRTNEGIPGKNYFVNRADYDIKTEYNPITRLLKGEETIYYTNNSSDTLQNIFINLYQNLLKKGNARDWDAGATDIHDGVKISRLLYNGQEIGIKSDKVNNNRSLIEVGLSEKLPPGCKAKFEIEWSFIMPDSLNARYGKFGEGNYLVAYWYPKIAVFDDIYGWDTFPFTGNQEFYNDLGDYNVEITVPAEYNVCSSGILKNPNEIYSGEVINRINQTKRTDSIINVVKSEDWANQNVFKKNEKRVWKFKIENTPDFTFAISNNYLWDATSIMSGNKRILINCFYKSLSEKAGIAEIARKAVDFFSNEIPAIQYPFNQVCVFESTGMEFPALAGCVVIGNKIHDFTTVSHEIGHAYFPFKTGLNEEKYAWMDEGLMTFYPLLLIEKNFKIKIFNSYIQVYNAQAGGILDIPLMVPTMNSSEWDTYTFQAYMRPSVAFYELYELIGKEKFVEGLQLFYETWEGKHPTPYDMFNCFNNVSGQDLSWFWKAWFFDFAYADLRVGELTVHKENNSIRIYNDGGAPVPIKLKVTYMSGEEKNIELKSDVWKGNNKFYDVLVPKGSVKSVVLDTQSVPDIVSENNVLNVN